MHIIALRCIIILKIIISVCTCVLQANKIRMDRFLIRRRVETPAETSSESSTSQPRTSGSCASSYLEAVSTLHGALENGADLRVNERQKIRHYHARSTEERRRKKTN